MVRYWVAAGHVRLCDWDRNIAPDSEWCSNDTERNVKASTVLFVVRVNKRRALDPGLIFNFQILTRWLRSGPHRDEPWHIGSNN